MKILGISYVVPSRKVTNDMVIEAILRLSRKHLSWIKRKILVTKLEEAFKKCGTVVRYVRSLPTESRHPKGERALDLTVRAGRDALQKAGVNPEDIDLLIYTGVGRGWLEPAMANVFQSELGLTRATCFDVMDACASWMRSMAIAKTFIEQGTYKTVMILNSEFNVREFGASYVIERLHDLYDLFAGYTIGEATTATIVGANGNPNDFYFTFRTWGSQYHLCQIPLPNAWDYTPDPSTNHAKPMVFYAKSRELLTFTVQKLWEHFRSDPYLSTKRYDIIFPHDVSDVSTIMATQLAGLDPQLLYRTHSRYGNTVSATIPLGMALALEEGRLKSGMEVLLACGSAGVSTAFCAFKYAAHMPQASGEELAGVITHS
ncbi:MAG: hypothetical protein HYY91_05625 [Candidatus Omnitrophica bacterium]|nr:hypothetical protein [Candidatus Omnitrophota bacterium]